MGILAGEWSTTSPYGSVSQEQGSFYNWHECWVPLTVTICDADIKQISEFGGVNITPSFSIEVEDTTTDVTVEVPDVSSVNITRNTEAASDSFGFSCTNAKLVSPRLVGAMQGKLQSDLRKRVHINAGFKINGVDKRIRIFSGFIMDRNEDWSATKASLTVQGLSLSYLLTVTPGVFQNYTGSLAGAVLGMLEDTGINCTILAIPDQLITEPLFIIAGSMEEALSTLFNLVNTVTWYLDQYGNLVVRDQGTLDNTPLFTYKAGINVYGLTPGTSGRAVVSTASVTGATPEASATVIDNGFITRFGTRRSSISSTGITSQDQAEAAGRSEIARSARALKHLGVRVPFSPIMEPMIQVKVEDSVFGSEIDTLLDVLRFSHSITQVSAKTNIDGETDQEM